MLDTARGLLAEIRGLNTGGTILSGTAGVLAPVEHCGESSLLVLHASFPHPNPPSLLSFSLNSLPSLHSLLNDIMPGRPSFKQKACGEFTEDVWRKRWRRDSGGDSWKFHDFVVCRGMTWRREYGLASARQVMERC